MLCVQSPLRGTRQRKQSGALHPRSQCNQHCPPIRTKTQREFDIWPFESRAHLVQHSNGSVRVAKVDTDDRRDTRHFDRRIYAAVGLSYGHFFIVCVEVKVKRRKARRPKFLAVMILSGGPRYLIIAMFGAVLQSRKRVLIIGPPAPLLLYRVELLHIEPK